MSDHIFLQLKDFLLRFFGTILRQLTSLPELGVFFLKPQALGLPFQSLIFIERSFIPSGVWLDNIFFKREIGLILVIWWSQSTGVIFILSWELFRLDNQVIGFYVNLIEFTTGLHILFVWI